MSNQLPPAPTVERGHAAPSSWLTRFVSDSSLLVMVTGLAYVSAYYFEVGAAQAVGMPTNLIDVQLLPTLSFLLMFILPFAAPAYIFVNYLIRLLTWVGLASDVFIRISLLYLGIAFVFILASIYAGRLSVEGAETYLIVDAVPGVSPEMVVLRIYGDRVVAAEFTRGGETVRASVKPIFRVMNIDESHVVLHREQVGPLSAAE